MMEITNYQNGFCSRCTNDLAFLVRWLAYTTVTQAYLLLRAEISGGTIRLKWHFIDVHLQGLEYMYLFVAVFRWNRKICLHQPPRTVPPPPRNDNDNNTIICILLR